MDDKTCAKCNKTKQVGLFKNGRNICKYCFNKEQNARRYKRYKEDESYREKIKKQTSERASIRYKEDESYREKIKQRTREYAKQNPQKVAERVRDNYFSNHDYFLNYHKEYRKKNHEKISNKKSVYQNIKRKTDRLFRLRCVVRNAVYQAILSAGSKKNGSILEHLPYSINELKLHLESLFEPWMNWDNWGVYDPETWDDNNTKTWTWQIDHIIKQADLIYDSMDHPNFQKCWALENLRPLSAKENVSVRNRREI